LGKLKLEKIMNYLIPSVIRKNETPKLNESGGFLYRLQYLDDIPENFSNPDNFLLIKNDGTILKKLTKKTEEDFIINLSLIENTEKVFKENGDTFSYETGTTGFILTYLSNRTIMPDNYYELLDTGIYEYPDIIQSGIMNLKFGYIGNIICRLENPISSYLKITGESIYNGIYKFDTSYNDVYGQQKNNEYLIDVNTSTNNRTKYWKRIIQNNSDFEENGPKIIFSDNKWKLIQENNDYVASWNYNIITKPSGFANDYEEDIPEEQKSIQIIPSNDFNILYTKMLACLNDEYAIVYNSPDGNTINNKWNLFANIWDENPITSWTGAEDEFPTGISEYFNFDNVIENHTLNLIPNICTSIIDNEEILDPTLKTYYYGSGEYKYLYIYTGQEYNIKYKKEFLNEEKTFNMICKLKNIENNIYNFELI
jgi:hypothetical protein